MAFATSPNLNRARIPDSVLALAPTPSLGLVSSTVSWPATTIVSGPPPAPDTIPATIPATAFSSAQVSDTFYAFKNDPKAEFLKGQSGIGHISPSNTPDPNALSIIPFNDVDNPLHLLTLAAEEEALFDEYYRLAHLFFASYNDSLKAATAESAFSSDLTSGAGFPNHDIGPIASAPPPPQLSDLSNTSAMRTSRNIKTRSAEMVRAPSLCTQDEIYYRDRVRRRQATFESLRILIVRDELRGEGLCCFGTKHRADLKAATLMISRGLWLNRDVRIIGSIPGISVGDIYFFRMEICIIGLHGHPQAGIDYVPARKSRSREPIATSIIVSGGYEDDDDHGYELIYTGQGGRDRNLHRMCGSQKLEGGNLSLERSMQYGIEIRVIRGMKFDQSPSGRIYVYDGLYRVVDCWMDAGKSGFGVYKYKLLRIEGQEEMGSTMIKFAASLKVNTFSERQGGFFCNDISMGTEKLSVSLYNDLDDDLDPLHYDYLARPIYPPEFQGKLHGEGMGGCGCNMNCSIGCYCATLNGGEFPYDGNGVLVRGRPLIYECGTACRCPPSCSNRVSQKGLTHRLEVFRSKETGWGVRSFDLIRSGTFICEFSGMILTKLQTDLLSTASESLVHPNRFPGRWAEWGDISDVFPAYMPPRYPYLPELSFSIDVSSARNVACYLSHSCCPNVFVQFVLFDHNSVSYPHVMIFAMENIPPLRDLSLDYGVAEEWTGKLTA